MSTTEHLLYTVLMTAAPLQKESSFWRGLKTIYSLMSRERRRQLFSVLVLMITGAVAELATLGSILPFLSLLTKTNRWSSLPLSGVSERLGISPLVGCAILFAVVAVTAGPVRMWLVYSIQNFSFRLGHDLLMQIQRRVLLQPYAFHLEQNSSRLLAAIHQVEALVFDVVMPAMQALAAAFLAVFIIGALVWIDPLAAIIAAVGSAAVYVTVSLFARKRLKMNSEVISESLNSRMQVAQESLGGIRDIIIEGSHDMHLELFRRLDLRLNIARANTGFIAAAPRYAIETAGLLIVVVIALVLAGQSGGVSAALPVLAGIAFGAQRLLPLLQQVYAGWSTASGFHSVMASATELLQLPMPAEASVPIDPLPLKKVIAIENLGFAYRGRRRAALDAISFDIPAGSAVALIGETGSGKSTLADLLMGLLEPTEGRITIDGTELTNERRRRWQQSIAHVPQSIFLADTSIARNVAMAFGDEQPELERVIEASRKAQLHNFVETLPDGYDTLVGERGVRLSGGQRQRLGLARAIYKQAPVLVLDEATSALDESTEAAVMDALDQLRREGRTILFIAHRQSTVNRATRVVTLSKGRLVRIEDRGAATSAAATA